MNLSLGRKVWALSLAMIALFGIANVVVYLHISDAEKRQSWTIDIRWPNAKCLAEANNAMNMARASLRDAILDSANPEAFAKDTESLRKNVEATSQAVATLQELAKGYAQQVNRDRARQIAENLTLVQAAQQRSLALARAGDPSAALREVRSISPQATIVRENLKTLWEHNNDLTNKLFRDEMDDMQASVRWLALLSLGGLVVAIAVSTTLARSVSRNAELLCRRANQIASGSLSGEPLLCTSGDEFQQLATSMNQMQSQLVEMIGKILATASALSDASHEIAEGSRQSSENARQQTDQTSPVATAIHEMSVTVREVSDHSAAAANAAAEAAGTAREGGKVVSGTETLMQQIVEANGCLAERMAKLGESSKHVGNIANVIDDIADQTNLLALNAAIEAARAGEQGRGFAVVADEVRKLAERTTVATKEISGILQEIQSETQHAVTATAQERQNVASGLEGVARAGEALKGIIAMAGKVGDMIAQIATASTEQASASDEIQESSGRIAEMAARAALAAEGSAQSCQRLAELSAELEESVSRFEVNRSAGLRRPGTAVPPAACKRHSMSPELRPHS
jgi:methyl-accepting chemotaxis protein